ncbi:hypothetical protein P3T25_001233 [Paraburkholderia sp. GAS32]
MLPDQNAGSITLCLALIGFAKRQAYDWRNARRSALTRSASVVHMP